MRAQYVLACERGCLELKYHTMALSDGTESLKACVGAHYGPRRDDGGHRDVRRSEVGEPPWLSEVARGGAPTSTCAMTNIRATHTRDSKAIGGLIHEKASRAHVRLCVNDGSRARVVLVARANEQRSSPHITGVQKRQCQSQCS